MKNRVMSILLSVLMICNLLPVTAFATDNTSPAVTVTFDSNDGSGSMEQQTVVINEDTNLRANSFVYDEHVFVGWNTAADGRGEPYADEAAVTLSGDLILYAQWQESQAPQESHSAKWVFGPEGFVPDYTNAAAGSLADAFSAANADNTNLVIYVQLIENVVSDSRFELAADKAMVLDLNQKGITVTRSNEDACGIYTGSDSALTVKNGNIAVEQVGYTGYNTYKAYGIYAEGTLTVDRCSITGKSNKCDAYGILADGYGELYITDCTIEAMGSDWSHGIHAANRVGVTILDSNVIAHSTNRAWGIYASGKVEISGGSIAAESDKDACGVYVDGADLELSNSPAITGTMVDIYLANWDETEKIILADTLSGEHLPYSVDIEYTFTVFTDGAERSGITADNFSTYFVSSSTSEQIVFDDGELKMVGNPRIYFETGDDSLMDSVCVPYGGTLDQPSAPEWDGYTFAGWYADEDYSKEFDFSQIITADTSIYAKWTFDATDVARCDRCDVYIPYGTADVDVAAAAEEFLKEVKAMATGDKGQFLSGLSVTNWRLAENQTMEGKTVGDTVVLVATVVPEMLPYYNDYYGCYDSYGKYAVWTGEKTIEVSATVAYIVTFDYVHDTYTEVVTEAGQKVCADETYMDRYTFVGWYTDPAYTTEYDFNNVVTDNFALYAKYDFNYTTDSAGIMAYQKNEDSFDILGYFSGQWKGTTFGDGGYETFLKVGENVERICLLEGGDTKLGLKVDVGFDFLNEGQTLQILYTVNNTTDAPIEFSLGSGADVQIGIDDSAFIDPFPDGSGYKMISDKDNDMSASGDYAQFNFFGKGYEGVTSVSDFWYGRYDDWSGVEESAAFYGVAQSESLNDDSAASWHWDSSVDAGKTKTYSVLIGIGGAGSENAASCSGLTSPTGSVTVEVSEDLTSSTQLVVKLGERTLVEGEDKDYTVDLADPDKPVIKFNETAGLTFTSCNPVVTITFKDTSTQDIEIENNIRPVGEVENGSLEEVTSNVSAIAIALQKNVVLSIKKENNVGDNENQSDITSVAVGKTMDFLDITLKETLGSDTLSEIPKVMEIGIPFDASGKDNITVYRHHNNEVDIFTSLSKKPAENIRTDGKFYVDTGNQKIYIYTSKFSTYAIGYTLIADSETFTVTFNATGGSVDGESTRTTGTSGKLTDLPVPTRAGYTFGGWFTAMSGGSQITADTVFNSNMTVYAQWTENPGPAPGSGSTSGSGSGTAPISGGSQSFREPHSCTSKCAVCGGCTGIDCVEDVCKDKCLLLSMNFTDVLDDTWCSDAVEYVYHRDMMKGISNNIFGIDDITTRAMIVTILWRLEGQPVVNYLMQFQDVPAESWCAEAIRWAASNEIITGYSDTEFGSTDPITREQFATFLWRYAKYKGYDVSVGDDINIRNYQDALSISQYAIPAMQWACGSGIMQGDGINLNPKAKATRSQAAVLIQRFCESATKK